MVFGFKSFLWDSHKEAAKDARIERMNKSRENRNENSTKSKPSRKPATKRVSKSKPSVSRKGKAKNKKDDKSRMGYWDQVELMAEKDRKRPQVSTGQPSTPLIPKAEEPLRRGRNEELRQNPVYLDIGSGTKGSGLNPDGTPWNGLSPESQKLVETVFKKDHADDEEDDISDDEENENNNKRNVKKDKRQDKKQKTLSKKNISKRKDSKSRTSKKTDKKKKSSSKTKKGSKTMTKRGAKVTKSKKPGKSSIASKKEPRKTKRTDSKSLFEQLTDMFSGKSAKKGGKRAALPLVPTDDTLLLPLEASSSQTPQQPVRWGLGRLFGHEALP